MWPSYSEIIYEAVFTLSDFNVGIEVLSISRNQLTEVDS